MRFFSLFLSALSRSISHRCSSFFNLSKRASCAGCAALMILLTSFVASSLYESSLGVAGLCLSTKYLARSNSIDGEHSESSASRRFFQNLIVARASNPACARMRVETASASYSIATLVQYSCVRDRTSASIEKSRMYMINEPIVSRTPQHQSVPSSQRHHSRRDQIS